jgi:hypothetical protein
MNDDCRENQNELDEVELERQEQQLYRHRQQKARESLQSLSVSQLLFWIPSSCISKTTTTTKQPPPESANNNNTNDEFQHPSQQHYLSSSSSSSYSSSSSWVLVENGSLGGFFDFVPLSWRIGPWNHVAILYLLFLFGAIVVATIHLCCVPALSIPNNAAGDSKSSIIFSTVPSSSLHTWYNNIEMASTKYAMHLLRPHCPLAASTTMSCSVEYPTM